MIGMFDYWNHHIERMPIEDLRKLLEERLRTMVSYIYDHRPSTGRGSTKQA